MTANWQDLALCAETDPEAFFPAKGIVPREAKRVCMACEVRADCLQFALGNDIREGVWGGTDGKQRRRMLREVRAAA